MAKITVLYFQSSFDIADYLAYPVGQARKDLSREHYGNALQFRNIKWEDNNVLGRFCKIRQKDKPTTGTIANSNEKELEDDVIESAVFRYFMPKRILLFQYNPHVTNSPNGLFLKLLRHIYPQDDVLHSEEAAIDPIMGADAFTKLRKERHLISKVSMVVDPRQRLSLARANNQQCDLYDKDYAAVKKTTINTVIGAGLLERPALEILLTAYTDKNIVDATFTLDGEAAVNLSNYYKRRIIQIDGKSGSQRWSELFNRFREINPTSGE